MQSDRQFDIAERASCFGESIIDFATSIPQSPINSPLISQIVRSGTSVGANLCEADESDTTKEFLYRISLAPREVKETQHWLRMVAKADPEHVEEGRSLYKEAEEIKQILSAIGRNTRNSPNRRDRQPK